MKTSVRGHRSQAVHVVARIHRINLPEILVVKRAKQHELDDDPALAGRGDELSEPVEIRRSQTVRSNLLPPSAAPGTFERAHGADIASGAGARVLAEIWNEPGTSR